MPGMPTRFVVEGLDDVERLLRIARAKAQNLAPVLAGPISTSITSFYRRMFLTRGQIGGERWAPLSRTTLQIKSSANRSDMGVLRFSNTLWASLTKRGGVHGVRVVQPQRLEQGTQYPPAIYAQEGFMSSHVFGKPKKRPSFVQPRRLVPREMPRPIVAAWAQFIARYVEP